MNRTLLHRLGVSCAALLVASGSALATITPVLEYRMGEDDSPNAVPGPAANPSKAALGGQDLTRRGEPQYVAGRPNAGSTHAVQVRNFPGGTPQFYYTDYQFTPTEPSQWGFSLWVKFDALPDPDKSAEVGIMHIGDINANSIILQTMASGGSIKFGTHAPGISINVGTSDVHLGRWTHLAVVFDGGQGRMYVDGVDEAAVGGGGPPPAGITLGAQRNAPGSFSQAANVTIDDVRVFEVPPGEFTVEDLGVPAPTGPYVMSSSGDPFGFTIEIVDFNGKALALDSIAIKMNGVAVTPTSITQPANTVITYQLPVESPLPAGVYGLDISYRDTAGGAYTDARSFRVRTYTLLPLDYATPAGSVDTTKPGFLVRPHQVASGQPNSLKWTEEQLAGMHGPNLANLAGATDGFFVRDYVIDFKNEAGRTGNFAVDAPFSEIGIPGPTLANEDNAAVEVLTFLDFPAVGFYTMGVNSDDGFRVTTGANARDRLGVVLGEFDGDRLAADSTFRIYVPRAGIYPLRLIWENGTGAASLEWFTALTDGTPVAINDTVVGGAVLAYRAGPSPAYVSSVVPGPGEQDAEGDAGITLQITDGSTTVDPANVRLGANGPAGTPTTIAKTDGVITATLMPATPWPAGSTNTATLVYTDSNNKTFTQSWTFVVAEQAGGTVLITPKGITQKAGDALDGYPVVNLINNSGFDVPPTAANYLTTTHGAENSRWVTATGTYPNNYYTAGAVVPQFEITLDAPYMLTHLVVWGYGGNNNEATDFEVEFSTDGGVTFGGKETVQVSTLLGGNSEGLAFQTGHAANAVRLTAVNNAGGRGFTGAGPGDRVGFGEVKFLGRALSLITPAGIAQKAGDTLDGYPVVNLINNSGFTVPPTAKDYAITSHGGEGSRWVTGTGTYPNNYFAAGAVIPQFELTLDQPYDLTHLVVWGYGGNNNEATDFEVEFSTDGGATFGGKETVAASTLLGSNAEGLVFTSSHAANAVRITMVNNAGGRGFTGAGPGDRVGLGEIKFLGLPPESGPEPEPTLSIKRSGADLEITFANGTLEATGNVPGGWAPVPNATSPLTVTPTGDRQFYRVRR